MFLEVLAKKGLGVEVQFVGNLLNAHAGVSQQVLGLADDKILNPLGGVPASNLLDNGGEVFGCDVQLVCVELHAPFPFVAAGQGIEKMVSVFLLFIF